MKKLSLLLVLAISLVFAVASCNSKTKPLAADETYTCEMHNEVMSDHPGKCPKCEMNLVKQKMTEQQKKMKAEGTFVKPKE